MILVGTLHGPAPESPDATGGISGWSEPIDWPSMLSVQPIAEDEIEELREVPPADEARGLHFFSPAGALEKWLAIPADFDSPLAPQDLHEVGPVMEAGFLRPIVSMPLGMVDTVLGPVKEMNLLLPKRLDPFTRQEDRPVVPSLLPGRLENSPTKFSQDDQNKLLGTSALSVADITNGKKWKWQVEAGGLFRQGNTAANNLNAQMQAEHASATTNFQMKAGAIYNNNGVDRPNRRFFGSSLFDRNLRGSWIAYAKEEVDSDRAALVGIRTVTSVGLGFRFINRVDRRLIARTGPSFSYVLFQNNPASSEPRGGWFLESEYRQVLFSTSRFEWTTTAYPDFTTQQQFRVRTDVALVFPIGGRTSAWNWKIGGRNFYQLNPVPGAVPNDVEAYFTIMYSR